MTETLPTFAILKSIKIGKRREMYKDWAVSGTLIVREMLARYGYQHDILIHDLDSSVRRLVMKTDPSYIKYRIGYPDDYRYIQKIMRKQVVVDLEVIEALIDYCQWDESTNTSLKVKHEALSREPTLLESNMSCVDLYLIGSPMWARNLTFGQTWNICDYLENGKTHDREEVERVFGQFAKPKVTDGTV